MAGKSKKPITKLALQEQMSSFIGRMRMLQRAGIQYQGNRDTYASAGYVRIPRYEDFLSYYTRNEIAGRIIDAKPKTTWRTPPDVVEGDAQETGFTKAFTKLADRLGLWSEFEIVDRRSGIGRYGVLLIGTKGTTPQQMVQPLQRLSGPEAVLYVRAYDERHAMIKSLVQDPGDARYGLPKTYQLVPTDEPGFIGSGMLVDASRVLHVAEDADDRVYGRPRIERVLNRIFDLDKIAASTGESYWQAVVRILQGKIDPLATTTPDQLAALKEAMAEMTHDLRREFFGQGIELGWLPSQILPVKDVAEFYFALIAVGSGIPRRILFGNESGELASSTDEATYFGAINERQEHFAEPQLVRAFIDRLIGVNGLPKPSTNGEYEVVWPELFQLTALEQAEANAKTAQAAAALTPIGGDPGQLVEIDDDRVVYLVPKEPGDPNLVLPPVAPGPLNPDGTPQLNPDGTPNTGLNPDGTSNVPPVTPGTPAPGGPSVRVGVPGVRTRIPTPPRRRV